MPRSSLFPAQKEAFFQQQQQPIPVAQPAVVPSPAPQVPPSVAPGPVAQGPPVQRPEGITYAKMGNCDEDIAPDSEFTCQQQKE